MSPAREPHETDDAEREPFDEGHRRTMFSTTWFRAAVVLVVLGVIAAVAVPYVLEMMNPPMIRMSTMIGAQPGNGAPCRRR